MKQEKKKRATLISIVVLFGLALAYLIFNDYGVVSYYELRSEIDSLKSQIEHIRYENARLVEQIDSLERNIPAKIEKIAREKYGMKRENEEIIRVDKEE